MLFLDTTVLIDYLRGDAVVVERIQALAERSSQPWVCAINVEEIWRGVRPGEEDAVKGLIAGLRLAPLGAAEGARAGRWRREYSGKGVTLEQADCLVAAAAVGVGARLVTANVKDFPMPELELEAWPAGR